jgi:ABC-type branched-subunit amino acid transport system ATPase component
MTSDEALLEVDSVGQTFGGVHALRNFSLTLPPAGRVAVIGPNGAGKSTLMNIIAGASRPDNGDVRLAGRSVRRLPSHARARRGIARTFQNLELFLSMSALDNVLTALDSESRSWSLGKTNGTNHRQRARRALARLDIEDYANTPAGALPYGVRKLVELSRALVTEPRVLLLDEPVAGLSHATAFVELLMQALANLDSAAVLVEHDMATVRTFSNHVHVLDSGEEIAQGSYEEIARNPKVVEAYLGSRDDNEPAEAATDVDPTET